MGYVGRFAPSPTGPLHFGSLTAALASFLEARRLAGRWLVRIDDVDRPRVVAGAQDHILRCLEAHQLHWDGEVVRQSERVTLYEAAFETLRANELIYPCACTRKALVDGRYPGYCRDGLPSGARARSFRLKTHDKPIPVMDGVQGAYHQSLWTQVGDFIVRRADDLVAYHLATVVDDAEQGVTDIVRGSDLLESTPRQVFLQQSLELPTPNYAHLPIALNERGNKLSKQTFALALDSAQAVESLWSALEFLGQAPPAELRNLGVTDLIEWALENWSLSRVPKAQDALILQ